MILFILVPLILSIPRVLVSESIRVGIVSNGMEDEEYRIVRSELEYWLLKYGFILLERDDLKFLFDEKKGISYGVFKADENKGRMDEILGADILIMLNDFTRFGYGEGVMAKVLDVESGRVLFVERKAIYSSRRDEEIEKFSRELSEKLRNILVKDDGRVLSRYFTVRKISSQSYGPVKYEIDVMKEGYLCVFVKKDDHYERIFSKHVLPSKMHLVLRIGYGREILFTLTDETPERILTDDIFRKLERGAYICDTSS